MGASFVFTSLLYFYSISIHFVQFDLDKIKQQADNETKHYTATTNGTNNSL